MDELVWFIVVLAFFLFLGFLGEREQDKKWQDFQDKCERADDGIAIRQRDTQKHICKLPAEKGDGNG